MVSGVAGARLIGWPAAMAAVALLLPVSATARWLGPEAGVAARVTGIWLFKATLLAVAAAAALTAYASARDARPERPTAAPRDPSTVRLIVAGILVAALLVRLIHLDAELWYDEIETLVRYVSLPVNHILGTYDSQNQHPLYSLLARVAWVATGGDDWSIRLPAVLFGVASLWAAYRFAKGVVSRTEAVLVMLILAVSYHHVWFSQNARGYTAMLFFTILATHTLLRLVDGKEPPARLAWAYAGWMALATFTHLTAALVAVGHALALVSALAWRRDLRWLRWPAAALALSGLLTVLLYAPILPQLVPVVLAPTMEGVEVEWTSGRWFLGEMFRVLASGVPGGLATVAVAVTVLSIGVASCWRQSRLLVLACLWPIVVTLVTMLALGHNLWPRFFFFAAAFIVLFAVRGGFTLVRFVLPRRAEAVALGGAVAVAALSAVTVPRAWQPKQQFLAAAQFVGTERQPGDAVVAVDMAAFAYDMRGRPAGWVSVSTVEELQALESQATRLWLLTTFSTHLRALSPELAAHVAAPAYREVRVFPATVGGGEIRVMLHDSGVSP